MIAKSLIAAAALSATMAVALPAAQAEAKNTIEISIGFGTGGFYPGFYYPGYYPAYAAAPSHISCKRGSSIVDRSGFNHVRAVDCSLPGFRYTAWKKGHKYMVRVNGSGRITDVNRIF